jgi:four helix bundle protein
MDRETVREWEQTTRQFSIDAISLARKVELQRALRPVADQLVRSAGSVGANHRALGRARSLKDFRSKLFIVHEEADEAVHWLSVLRDANQDATLTPHIGQLFDRASRIRNFFGRARATTRAKFPG